MQVEVFSQGFDAPWGFELLPDGRALVTERTAGLTLLAADGARLATIENVPPSFVKLQGGLFDVVAHPQFATNSTLYLSLAHGTQKHNTTRVVRAVLRDNALVDVTVIFDSTPKGTAVHYGGRLAFMLDGTLLVTTGEGADYREHAQRLDSLLGKVIRLNDDGTIPQDNPFVGRDQAQPAIWSYGHRNPQGLCVDAKTGSVYVAEHGPRGGDEVNFIERQANYGWPIATHGIDYPGSRISPFDSYPGMREPLVYWTPSIGVGGVAVYRGEMFPEWDGDIFITALGGRHLRRIDVAGAEVVKQERLLEDLQARFRQVEIGRDGALYVVVESIGDRPHSGRILRITRPIRPAPTVDSSRPST
ncbi:PQQ-dependent sugar dehydrogenase [Steroidobacter cummioxidans]|uniref:PQQ-dependent sugar dehydrogenase n=1 Tax=Steroidobacter cummioxidans TaxID=1803913 RepID=UPI000E31D1C7|nr:PQQ-dependent sugar dehydrogenase [Steroidobacter cummioxidans]